MLIVAGCKPTTMYLRDVEGPKDYVAGYNDGCDSVLSKEGSTMQQWTHRYKKNPDGHELSLYRMGWNEGYTYCKATITK